MSTKSYIVSGLALFALAMPATAAAVEIGPAPTEESVRAVRGPFTYSKRVFANSATPGFGQGSVWAPTNGAPGQTFGAVAIAPGWTESESVISWLGPRLASQGFVVITFSVNNTLTDLPPQRGQQLNAALKFLTSGSSGVRDRVDPERLAAIGHSMGGGGALEAAKANSRIDAVVGLMPWNTTVGWQTVTAASLMIGSANDTIAPPNSHAYAFYNSIPATTPKAYQLLRGADHFASNKPNGAVATSTLSWLKRYLDGDTRYTSMLVPDLIGPPTNSVQQWTTNNVN